MNMRDTVKYIASAIFDIILERPASSKGMNGRFDSGNLVGKTVQIQWYGKMEGQLDISPNNLPDFYLVITGSITTYNSSQLETKSLVISDIYLFDVVKLIGELKKQDVKIGVSTNIQSRLWEEAEIYPKMCNKQLTLSDEQRNLIRLFK